MSTSIKDRVILKEVLESLGWSVEEGDLKIKGLITSEPVSILAGKGGRYNIGFRETPQGSFELVADWWGVQREQGFSEDEFKNLITQQYAKAKVIKEASRLGYAIAIDEVVEDGTIRLVMRKWQ